jgi:hypothetical protein
MSSTDGSTAHDVTIEETGGAGIHTGSFGRFKTSDKAEVFERKAGDSYQGQRN